VSDTQLTRQVIISRASNFTSLFTMSAAISLYFLTEYSSGFVNEKSYRGLIVCSYQMEEDKPSLTKVRLLMGD